MEVSLISKKDNNSIVNMFINFIIVMTISFVIIYTITTFVGIGLLTLIGFEYDSIKSVFVFFFIFILLNIPLDFISTSILDFIHFKVHISKLPYKLLEFLVESILVLIILSISDAIMNSIFIPFKTKILFSLLLYIFTSSVDFLFLKDKDS